MANLFELTGRKAKDYKLINNEEEEWIDPQAQGNSANMNTMHTNAQSNVLMVTLVNQYIRKILKLVFFPTRVARYCVSAVQALMTEVSVVSRLTVQLWNHMLVLPGRKWIVMLLRLIIYAILLMPGFIQVGIYYFLSGRVRRSIVYGPKPRNRLDLFLPSKHIERRKLPVVIFITGGAWIIGYKAWGSLLGKVLSKEGVLVISLDYRNFPQGMILDMLEDVQRGIGWVINNIEEHGGDASNICIVGQSAGAHLASLAIVDRAESHYKDQNSLLWTPKQIRAFVGVSGAYDIRSLAGHFSERGLHKQLLDAIMTMNGRISLTDISPAHRIQRYIGNKQFEGISTLFPPVVLLHGKDDRSIPFEHAVAFFNILEKAEIHVSMNLYDGETHTTPLIENPMRGSSDKLSEGVLNVIMPNHSNGIRRNRRLVPELLIKIATEICPF